MRSLFFTLLIVIFVPILIFSQSRADNIIFFNNHNLYFSAVNRAPKLLLFYADETYVGSSISKKGGQLALYANSKGIHTRTGNLVVKSTVSDFCSSSMNPYGNSDSLYQVIVRHVDTLFVYLIDSEFNNAQGRLLKTDVILSGNHTSSHRIWQLLPLDHGSDFEIIKHPKKPDAYWYIYFAYDSTINCRVLDKNGLGPIVDSFTDTNFKWVAVQNERNIIASRDGSKIMYYSIYGGDSVYRDCILHLIEFDNINGTFKRKYDYDIDTLYTRFNTNPLDTIYNKYFHIWCQGKAFSSDGNKFYTTVKYNRKYLTPDGDSLVQYSVFYQIDLKNSLEKPTFKQIYKSDTKKTDEFVTNDLVLGPDNVIYFTCYPFKYLGVVYKPNEFGDSCKFGLDMTLKSPTETGYFFPFTYLGPIHEIVFPDTVNICEKSGISVPIKYITNTPPDSVFWKGKLPFTVRDTSFTIATALTSMSGIYEITAYFGAEIVKKKFYFNVYPKPEIAIDMLPTDKPIVGETVTLQVLSSISEISYLWNTGETTQEIKVTKPGKYTVTAISKFGCSETKSIDVKFYNSYIIDIEGDTVLCDGSKGKLLIKNKEDLDYVWSTNETGKEIIIDKAGKYWVKATYNGKPVYSDTIEVKIASKPEIKIISPKGIKLCPGGFLELEVDGWNAKDNIRWSDGSKLNFLKIGEPGKYKVTVTNISGCITIDSIQIYPGDNPNAEIIAPDTIICRGTAMELSSKYTESDYSYQWNTGANTANITIYEGGTYILNVKLPTGCFALDTVKINESIPPLASIIASDSSICSGQAIQLKAKLIDKLNTYKWNHTNQTDTMVTVDKPGTYYLTVTNNYGCSSTDSIFIKDEGSINASIKVIGNTVICSGDSTILRAEPLNQKYSYKWSSGETTPEIVVKNQGTYSVTITNENSCSANASIEIKYASLPKIDENEIVFDEIELGNSIEKQFIITNDQSNDIVIDQVNSNTQFELVTDNLPITLKPAQSTTISIKFTPENIGLTQDFLFLSINKPCAQTYKIPLKGSAYLYADLSVDTLTTIVGDDNARISLFAKYDKVKTVFANTLIKGKFKYNQYLYGVENAENFNNFSNDIQLGTTSFEDSLKINGLISINMGTLIGKTFLDVNKTSPIELIDLESSNKFIKLRKTDGRISTYAICGEDIRKIKLFKQTELNVNSVNTGEIKYSFYTEDKGEVELELRDINGSLINKMNYTNTDKLEINSVMPTNEIGSGVYLISLNTRWGKIVKKISLIK